MLGRIWRKGKPPTILVGMQVDAATMENSGKQKTKNRITIWASNPTPGHILRQNSNPEIYMHPYVRSSPIHNNQDMEAT